MTVLHRFPVFGSLSQACAVIAACLLLSGCAAQRLHQEGMELLDAGQVDAGLAKLQEAVVAEPTNGKYRAALYTGRADAINRFMGAAAAALGRGRPDEAEGLLRRVLAIEPANDRAQRALDEIARDRRLQPLLEQARAAIAQQQWDKASELLQAVQRENPGNGELIELKRQIAEHLTRQAITGPTLRPLYDKRISLEFRDAGLKHVMEALSRETGVGFIFDKDVRTDLKVTVFMKDAFLDEAIDLILQTSALSKKVLNRNTVLIYPNNPEKLKDYQELVVRGFFLANADPKQAQATLKTLLKAKDVVVDEKLNLLIMRDTPEAIQLAEKILAMQDMFEPEVMLEVEVLEVKRTRLAELGIKLPDQIIFTPLNAAGTAANTLAALHNLSADRIGISALSATVNLKREVTDSNLLANPRIRARNREKAKILIGDRVPVITTTSTATGFVSESVQYIDVGLKLDVEPTILLRDEVAIRIGLEVSSLVREIKGTTGSLSYQIGTRTASTTLQLKDGETQILAGLISDEDRSTASRIPGLGDMPMLGRLFSSQKDDRQKTEIVLSITPRVVRKLGRPEPGAGEFWSGTESVLKTRPVFLPSPEGDKDIVLAMADVPATSGAPVAAADADRNVRVRPSAAVPKNVELSFDAKPTVKAGDVVEVVLRMKADGGVSSMPLQLSFDTAALQVVEVREGEYFRTGNGDAGFSSTIDAQSGKVFLTAGTRQGVGLAGEHSIAVLKVRALTATRNANLKVLAALAVSPGQGALQPPLPAPLMIEILP